MLNHLLIKQDVIAVLLNEVCHEIGPQWTAHQLEWTNTIYQSFKDHDKFLITIYLVLKIFDFYSRNFTKVTYDHFYSHHPVALASTNCNMIECRDCHLYIPFATCTMKYYRVRNCS